jgi:hypothetical protein
VHPIIVVRQRLGKNVTAATNTHVNTKECWARRFLCSLCRAKVSRRLVKFLFTIMSKSSKTKVLRAMLLITSYLQITFRIYIMGLKLLHERGNIQDHWSGTLLETFVLTFTDYQSISVEAVTCLSVMVHWIQSYACLRTPRDTGQKPDSQQNTQACQVATSLIEIVNLHIIALRVSESRLAFRISKIDVVCLLS